ncbi:MAG: aminomethyl-transferring glycine dehydrogenase [Bacteroidales bacterium]|nr:aminomethyl-transferring glycine dehydrogenase [Bacteroidales bacterium]
MKTNELKYRHIGISPRDTERMLKIIGVESLDELIKKTIPEGILYKEPLKLPEPLTEYDFGQHIRELSEKNKCYTTYIGQGWYNTITPAVIRRNVLENPVWYTSYTPYQGEISQGRLEALMNFQTMVSDLTGLPLANSSLLDEATAGAEAMSMMYNLRTREQKRAKAQTLFIDKNVFPETVAVIKTRALPLGIKIIIDDYNHFTFTPEVFGCIIQYPNTNGVINDYKEFVEKAHQVECKVAVAADILSLTLLTPPGEWGADIAFGNTQRMGIPLYYGGPSAGYFATHSEHKRHIPGRIIGLSKDRNGKLCYRMALQTREQHIKRERATSNICTAQALLATMAGFYAVYHGAKGLKEIGTRIHNIATLLNQEIEKLGYAPLNPLFFDTIHFTVPNTVTIKEINELALSNEINLAYTEDTIRLSIDETTGIKEINKLLTLLAKAVKKEPKEIQEIPETSLIESSSFKRTSDFLTHEVFQKYHTETEMMRYIKRLDRKDISLAHSMISLGSCTMKLNAASEVSTLTLPGFMGIHPLVPKDQAEGYLELIERLGKLLQIITGFEGVSFQPNSGAAGEYAGLRVIRSYLEEIGEGHRDKVIIPASAHGTNPASAVQAGYTPITCASNERGDVDMDDFKNKLEEYGKEIAALMITYPSTHGIFEKDIVEMCQLTHNYGAQVYMDGANMNGQVGLTSPGLIGADVCHLNLHKTFASPHGGGGPGVGPICVAKHLIPHLPGHTSIGDSSNQVSSAPYGSAGILPITYGYIRMMGIEGLTQATKTAILSANYLAKCFEDTYGIVYRGENGYVGHEMILECRKIKEETGISEVDIAKRLMDYGYHAPTLSFPVAGTLMIEPTESESLAELNNFVEVMLSIYEETQEVKTGKVDQENNVLRNSPHPEYEAVADEWPHPYSREKAVYPISSVKDNKFWINVARIDDTLGDRNLLTTRYDSFEE